MQSGKIGVTTENIFPVIKKFLYSEHDIFIRELVSNAVDASQKLKALVSLGKANVDISDMAISVSFDSDKKTVTISDKGIGMSQEEVEKYINQIAFSGAEEFLEKYKDQTGIIGHFGLGFYSSFMVAKHVDVITKSYKEECPAIKWSCDGSPEYTIEETTRQSHGTDIILHLADDSLEYADKNKLSELLNKYCRFLPVPIIMGKKTEWKDGQSVETDEDNVVNDTNPLWTRTPSEIKPEEYKEFYHSLYPMGEEPLFNIHLNVDYPFNLTGILYFPKIKSNIELVRNKIQLYCNQVFVTDSVEGIVPEFLTLLHGVIDSPDIPLNVSRSYLQGDPNVKKISSHITKKVSDRLSEIFNKERSEFEAKWDDLKLFIQYGIITEEKFADRAKDFVLLKNLDGKYCTISEYKELIEASQTDKNGDTIVLYTNDEHRHVSFIESAKAKGYDVLDMGGQLDTHFIGWAEQKNEKLRFVRIDSDVIDRIIDKEQSDTIALSTSQQEILSPILSAQLPAIENSNFNVEFAPMSSQEAPVVVTQNEFMRRMKDMSAMGGQMSFYGQMPDSYNLTVNGNHPVVLSLLEDAQKSVADKISSVDADITKCKSEQANLEKILEGKNHDQLSKEEIESRTELSGKLESLQNQKSEIIKNECADNLTAKHIVDLALLSSGLLKGKDLLDFIKRSTTMLENK